MTNPYYDPDLLTEWMERIARLRSLSDMAAPWEMHPDTDSWTSQLGAETETGDLLSACLLDWQVWIRSLSPEQRSVYEAAHPEPDGWGMYELTFSSQTSSHVPEDRGAEVYWDGLVAHYRELFGGATKPVEPTGNSSSP